MAAAAAVLATVLAACTASSPSAPPASPAPPATPPPTCELAAAAAKQKRLKDAQAAYAALLTVSAITCDPRAELVRLAQLRGDAVALYEEGTAYPKDDPTRAADLFSKALAIDPLNGDARTALESLGKPAPSPTPAVDDYVVVRRLLDLGQRDQALEKLAEAAADGPVPADLEDRLAGPTWFRSLQGTAAPVSDLAAAIAASPLPAIALGIVIALLLRKRWGSYRKWVLDVDEFGSGSSKAGVEKAMGPLIEDALIRFDQREGTAGVSLVSGPGEDLSLPAEVKGASAPLQIVAQLIGWAVKPRRLTLSGTLLFEPDRGAGVSVSMLRAGAVIDSIILWQRDYEPGLEGTITEAAEGYRRLVEPAAAWVRYALERAVETKTPFAPLGASNWRSYAVMTAGVGWKATGKTDKALPLFLESVERDDQNRGGHFNLGVTRTELAKSLAQRDQALATLTRALELATTAKGAGGDTVWYKALYQRAVEHAYRADTKGADKSSELTAGLSDVELLLTKINDPPADAKTPTTKELRITVRPLALVLKAGLLAASGRTEEAAKSITSLTEPERRSRSVLYSLACYGSTLAKDQSGNERVMSLRQALTDLEAAFSAGYRARWARTDPSLETLRTDETSLDGKRTKELFLTLVERYDPPKKSQNLLGKIVASFAD